MSNPKNLHLSAPQEKLKMKRKLIAIRIYYRCQVKDCGKEIRTNGDMEPIVAHFAEHEVHKFEAEQPQPKLEPQPQQLAETVQATLPIFG
jgi:hypothetical protein